MGRCGHARRCRFGCALLMIAEICAVSLASPSQLIENGWAELEKGRADIALRFFTQASSEDPKDAEAAFFAGVALNRLGRGEAALAQLSSAKQLGLNHPD